MRCHDGFFFPGDSRRASESKALQFAAAVSCMSSFGDRDKTKSLRAELLTEWPCAAESIWGARRTWGAQVRPRITWPTRVPSRKNTRVVHRHSGLLTWLPRRDTTPSKTGRKAVLPFGIRRALPNLLQPQRTPGTQARLRPGPPRPVGRPPTERASGISPRLAASVAAAGTARRGTQLHGTVRGS
jgi:hypothetical protein